MNPTHAYWSTGHYITCICHITALSSFCLSFLLHVFRVPFPSFLFFCGPCCLIIKWLIDRLIKRKGWQLCYILMTCRHTGWWHSIVTGWSSSNVICCDYRQFLSKTHKKICFVSRCMIVLKICAKFAVTAEFLANFQTSIIRRHFCRWKINTWKNSK